MATRKINVPPESWINEEVTIDLVGGGTPIVGKLLRIQNEYYLLNRGGHEVIISKGAVATMSKTSSTGGHSF